MVGHKRRPEGSRMIMRKTSLILLGAAAGVAVTLIATQARHQAHGAACKSAGAGYQPPAQPIGRLVQARAGRLGEKADDSKLIESAINGMLAGLDPHSSYMDSKSFRD